MRRHGAPLPRVQHPVLAQRQRQLVLRAQQDPPALVSIGAGSGCSASRDSCFSWDEEDLEPPLACEQPSPSSSTTAGCHSVCCCWPVQGQVLEGIRVINDDDEAG